MSKTARTHLIILGSIALIALILIFWWDVDWTYPLWWLIWGTVTFFYYGYDKRQAKKGAWRVPESILHMLAATGGFLGGWAGMFTFRHKTQEPVFKVVLALSTAGWVALWLWSLWRV
jgi:uncharacterized membrane protein YsdA (DUF1294 family)